MRINLKKIIFSFLAGLAILQLSWPALVLAEAEKNITDQMIDQIDLGSSILPGYNENTEPEIVIGKIIGGLLGFLGVLFLLLIIYGGFFWMTARGDEALVEKGKNIIIRATIGLVIVIISGTISWFIYNLFLESTGLN